MMQTTDFSHILKKENIILGQPSEDYEDVIRRCGRLLVDGKYVTGRYIEGMLARERELSTAIGNYIAIPHGKKEYKKDILSTGIVVVTYPDGISWNGASVYLVIGIAAVGDEHLDILGNVVENLESEDDVLKLVREADENMIRTVFCGKGGTPV